MGAYGGGGGVPDPLSLENYLEIGALPAQSGALRLSNNSGLNVRNAANDANIAVFFVNALDAVTLGTSAFGVDVVGSTLGLTAAGGISLNNGTTVPAGGGSATAKLGGPISIQTTPVGNVGAGTDPLMSYVLPASSLAVNGQGVRVTIHGYHANNADAKSFRLDFGGANLFSRSLTTSVAGAWRAVVEIFRTGTDTQRWGGIIFNDAVTPTAVPTTAAASALAQDDGATITIQTYGVGVSNDDVVQTLMIVEFLNQP